MLAANERDAAAPGDRQLTSLLAAIVASCADAIFSVTLDGIVTSWNAAAADMYGYTAAEITGHSIAGLIPPGRAGELPEILDRLRRGERVEHYETQRVCHDGTVIDVSISVSPTLDAAGQVTGAATVARDITERNRATAQIRAYRDQISRAERMETVGQLAGGVAHDFNNLLGAIIGFANLIAQETADPAAVAEDAREIIATAHRAAQLTRDLLILSRRAPTQPRAISVNTLISDISALLIASLGQHVTLRLDLADGLPDIYADPGRIEQSLLSLAINARDAMPDGGELTIATAGAHLDGPAARQISPGLRSGHHATITVTDTGIGMSPDVAARIFEPFFTTKELGHGTGLGLSTVNGIITQAGGAITVRSGPGAGTTFHILIPAATAVTAATTATAVPGVAGPAGPRAGHETVLIADDEPAMLRAASRILRLSGYTTLQAGSAYAAMSLLTSNDVDLLVTDSLMPGMSGTDLAGHVAQLRPGLPILHMSGYRQPGLAGQGNFIQKPFTGDALLGKVREMLDLPPGR